MSAVEPLAPNDNDPETIRRHFIRTVTTPPGPPWDQSRQAALEARLGAPSRHEDVVFKLKRLEPWRPARSARFAIIYVRADDARAGVRETATVDGRTLPVHFDPPGEARRRAVNLLLVTAAGTALAGLCTVMTFAVVSRRGALESQLSSVEASAAANLRRAEDLSRSEDDARTLDKLGLRGRGVDRVLIDLAQVSTAKAPNAHVWAYHWDHGFIAAEAGVERPLLDGADRPMQKSRAPLRPGVWLWGLTSVEPWSGTAGQPAAAQVRR